MENKVFLEFEITINVLVSSPASFEYQYTMLSDHYKCLIISVRGSESDVYHVYRRHILTSIDGPRSERVSFNYKFIDSELEWFTSHDNVTHVSLYRTRIGNFIPDSSQSKRHYEPLRNTSPGNTRRYSNAGLMLAHRLRRWSNISPASDQRLVFAGSVLN